MSVRSSRRLTCRPRSRIVSRKSWDNPLGRASGTLAQVRAAGDRVVSSGQVILDGATLIAHAGRGRLPRTHGPGRRSAVRLPGFRPTLRPSGRTEKTSAQVLLQELSLPAAP